MSGRSHRQKKQYNLNNEPNFLEEKSAFAQDFVSLIDAFARNVQRCPEKIFVVYRDHSYTYGEIDSFVNGFAAFLHSRGVGKGDRVCLALPRVPQLIISFLGAIRLGAVPAPVNYSLKEAEFKRFVHRTAAAALVISNEFVRSLGEEFADDDALVKILVKGEAKGFVPWEFATELRPAVEKAIEKPAGVLYLNYTTGSTGEPKGAIATHENIYWNTFASVRCLAIDHNDVHLCMFAAFAHPHELFARAVYTGGTVVLLEEVNPRAIVDTIQRHTVTCMMGLAPMYDMINRHCSGAKLSSLRIAESGGMFTRPEISREFLRLFGVPVLSVWGSTETSGIALANTPECYRLDGSMGKPCPSYEVRLVSDAGDILGPNQEGEMLIKGPGVIQKFDGQPACILDQGWYRSGDIATRNDDGFYYFVERRSGMVKVAGLKVYPLQVELAILGAPGVQEAAVIGIKERTHGMSLKAFVVADAGVALDSEEIKIYCRGLLPNYMIPKVVEIVPDLPKIGSGKINKKELASRM